MVYATAPGTRALNLWDGAGLARTQARRHGAVFPLKIACLRTDFGGQISWIKPRQDDVNPRLARLVLISLTDGRLTSLLL